MLIGVLYRIQKKLHSFIKSKPLKQKRIGCKFVYFFAIYFLQTSKLFFRADEHNQTTKSGDNL